MHPTAKALPVILVLLYLLLEDGWKWCLLLLGVVVGNLLLLKLDLYTSSSDRAAIATTLPVLRRWEWGIQHRRASWDDGCRGRRPETEAGAGARAGARSAGE